MRILIFILIVCKSISSIGQIIDIETEKFPGIKKLTVKYYNRVNSKAGYRYVYSFDNKGNAQKLSYYHQRRFLGSVFYQYNKTGLLTKEIYLDYMTERIDTIRYSYYYDSIGRIISKIKYFGKNSLTESYQDFNKNNLAQLIIRTIDNKTTIIWRTFNALNQEIITKTIQDTLISMDEDIEEIRYNEHGDIIFSNCPTLLNNETGEMYLRVGGNRHSVVEEYQYKYDNSNRWIMKYLILNNKKILLEQRRYR